MGRPDCNYYITEGDGVERQVTQAEFVQYENRCGFRPKPGCGPVATGGFSGTAGFLGTGPTIRGRVQYLGR